ncbi:hypothetical protein HpSIM50_15800 [Helicobacter pylori]
MKIKLTLKIPSKTPYKGIKLQQLERFLQKKKKQDFIGGLALNFWGF